MHNINLTIIYEITQKYCNLSNNVFPLTFVSLIYVKVMQLCND